MLYLMYGFCLPIISITITSWASILGLFVLLVSSLWLFNQIKTSLVKHCLLHNHYVTMYNDFLLVICYMSSSADLPAFLILTVWGGRKEMIMSISICVFPAAIECSRMLCLHSRILLMVILHCIVILHHRVFHNHLYYGLIQ